MLVKFEQNHMVQTSVVYTNFSWGRSKCGLWSKLHEILSVLTKKKKTVFFLNHFWQNVDAILEGVSVAETIVLMLN